MPFPFPAVDIFRATLATSINIDELRVNFDGFFCQYQVKDTATVAVVLSPIPTTFLPFLHDRFLNDVFASDLTSTPG